MLAAFSALSCKTMTKLISQPAYSKLKDPNAAYIAMSREKLLKKHARILQSIHIKHTANTY